MNISINPSYFCNFSCKFCYLTPEQLNNQKRIDLKALNSLLKQVPKIDYIDLYGGEIGALSSTYFKKLKKTIRKYYKGEINIITNFSMLSDNFFADDISLSVSYDFTGRERHAQVFSNMLMSPKRYSVLLLATEDVIKMDVDSMVSQLNILRNLDSVEIKPYSINQANSFNVTHKDYEDFVIKWLECDVPKGFTFGNKRSIEKSLKKEYNAFSDDHIYITPNGKFGVLDFDKDDKELFLELDNFKEYLEWCEREKAELSDICNSCKYLGTCLTEHYRYVENLDNSCNGYIGLLDYYDKEHME